MSRAGEVNFSSGGFKTSGTAEFLRVVWKIRRTALGRIPGSGINKPKDVRRTHSLVCVTCGLGFESFDYWRRVCGPACFVKPVRPTVKEQRPRNTSRAMRVNAAPGLTRHDLKLLLRLWKRQSRSCIYCGAVANTVDHVLPISRGGTNHEGNLAPACRSCNSRKGSLMVVEFRAGRKSAEHLRFASFSPSKRARLAKLSA